MISLSGHSLWLLSDTMIPWVHGRLSNEAVWASSPRNQNLFYKPAPGKESLASGPGRRFPLEQMTRSLRENILPFVPPVFSYLECWHGGWKGSGPPPALR